MKPWVANLLLIVCSIVLPLALFEGAARVWYGEYRFMNFPLARQSLLRGAYPAEFDPTLGYRPRAGRHEKNPWGTVVTIDNEGLRINGQPEPLRTTNLILAVGDSFTFGDQVNDHESWPAALEKLLDVRVLNAGVFGYGLDQSVMRAELIAKGYSLDVLLLSLIPDNIDRTELSVRAGVEKPVYAVEDGELQRLNPVLAPEPVETDWLAPVLRRTLGYSFLAHKIASRLFPTTWRAGRGNIRLHQNGVAVSCKFLERFSAVNARYKIVIFQYWLEEIDAEARPANAQALLECARELNLQVLDLFDGFRRLLAEDPEKLDDLFFGRQFGHMTKAGNEFVAEAVVKVLTKAEVFTDK